MEVLIKQEEKEKKKIPKYRELLSPEIVAENRIWKRRVKVREDEE